MLPRARPREAPVHGDSCEYSHHSSARNGRWNHIAWSRLASATSVPNDSPCGSSTESSSVMSLAKVTAHTCSSGSSGSVPSARIQTCEVERRRPVSLATRGGSST